MSLQSAAALGVLTSICVGCAIELSVIRPLRRLNGRSDIMLLASLGLYIMLQNILAMAFGDEARVIRSPVSPVTITVLGARVTGVHAAGMCFAIGLAMATYVLRRASQFGKEIRAVETDMELAKIFGVNTDRVIFGAFALGSAFAGIGGLYYALDVDLTPTMGLPILMIAIVAVVVSGTRNPLGIALATLLLVAVRQCAAWVWNSQWQDSITFMILAIFLVVRAQRKAPDCVGA